MAMNKKEQTELDAAKKAVIVARALNWSAPVLPDVPIPSSGETIGFLFNAYSASISHARSSSTGHATGWDKTPPKTTSQGARQLFSTKLLALKAMRHEVEKECAEKLAKIDIEIALERGKS